LNALNVLKAESRRDLSTPPLVKDYKIQWLFGFEQCIADSLQQGENAEERRVGVSDVINQVLKWVPQTISAAVRNRFIRGPIATVADAVDFVQTRSAFVAQTSLFGYLKERMGTSYPKHFENEEYVESIRMAQVEVYHACAADLAIFVTANIAQAGSLNNEETVHLAVHCYTYALENSGREEEPSQMAQAIIAFRERAERTLWPQAALEENAFTESLKRLIEAAPVIEEFKAHDNEIVTNSIRFRWRDIREQFRKRAECVEIAEDFLAKKLTHEI
jgi:hypothetical protein